MTQPEDLDETEHKELVNREHAISDALSSLAAQTEDVDRRLGGMIEMLGELAQASAAQSQAWIGLWMTVTLAAATLFAITNAPLAAYLVPLVGLWLISHSGITHKASATTFPRRPPTRNVDRSQHETAGPVATGTMALLAWRTIRAAEMQSKLWVAIWFSIALALTLLLAVLDTPSVVYFLPLLALLLSPFAGLRRDSPESPR